MKNKLLLVLGTALLVFGLSSCGSEPQSFQAPTPTTLPKGSSNKTLVQVICEDITTAPGSRFITYFWSDGSSDFYFNKVAGTSTNGVRDTGYVCPTPARTEDMHFYFEYPPVKTP